MWLVSAHCSDASATGHPLRTRPVLRHIGAAKVSRHFLFAAMRVRGHRRRMHAEFLPSRASVDAWPFAQRHARHDRRRGRGDIDHAASRAPCTRDRRPVFADGQSHARVRVRLLRGMARRHPGIGHIHRRERSPARMRPLFSAMRRYIDDEADCAFQDFGFLAPYVQKHRLLKRTAGIMILEQQ